MPDLSLSFFRASVQQRPAQENPVPEEMKGYDDLHYYFENEIDKWQQPLTCPKTQKIFKNPVKFDSCSHVVEEDSAIGVLKNTKKCPCCNSNVGSYALCEATRANVDDFLITFPKRVKFQYKPNAENNRNADNCGCSVM